MPQTTSFVNKSPRRMLHVAQGAGQGDSACCGSAHSIPLRLAPHHIGGRVGRPRVQLRPQIRREGLRRILCGSRLGLG